MAFVSISGVRPRPQRLRIATTSTTGGVTWNAKPNRPWIHLSQTSGTAPATIKVFVSPEKLRDRSYRGEVSVSGASRAAPDVVSITLSIYSPPAVPAEEKRFYVSPDGQKTGDGSRSRPWDLATALSQPAVVTPGSLLWLQAGVYKGDFVSRLEGSASAPIIVRSYNNERVTIDGSLLVRGAHAWYWGLEVTRSHPNRIHAGPHRDSVVVFGPQTRFINLVVHDGDANGFGWWGPAVNSELYGSLIYYNGYHGADRGHGHGIYTQNSHGTKAIEDNIIFQQFGAGIHAYGTNAAYVRGYEVRGNIIFENGAIAAGSGRVDNILFAGTRGLDRIRIEDNHTYHNPERGSGYSRLGWGVNGSNRDLIVRNNDWIGGSSALGVWNWGAVTFTGNTIYTAGSLAQTISVTSSPKRTGYIWDRNSYYGTGRFQINDIRQAWTTWASSTGFDGSSTYRDGRPTREWVIVRPNKYEPGRAHITIYNWPLKDSVSVDLSGILPPGSKYQLRDALNFYAPPVLEGTLSDNGLIKIPLSGLSSATPVGRVPSPPRHTAPEFAVFVLLPAGHSKK